MTSRRSSRVAVAAAMMGMAAAGLLAAPAVSAASSARAADAGHGAMLGVARPNGGAGGTARTGAVSAPSSTGTRATGNMTYHGGPVMQQANNTVALFWLPPKLQDGHAAATGANYVPLIKRYFADIGGSKLNQIVTQYFQVTNGKKQFILNASKTVLAEVNTAAYPKAGPGCNGASADCVDDAQIRNYVLNRIHAHTGLPEGSNTTYYVFLAPHETSCYSTSDCFKSDITTSSNFTFCAYHSFTNDSKTGKFVIYANMPDSATANQGLCTALHTFPNDSAADTVISITSHEQLESTTNPFGVAWYYLNTSGEIGDLCNYNYGSTPLDGGKANESMHGHFYVVQQEWSNKIHGCSQGVAVP